MDYSRLCPPVKAAENRRNAFGDMWQMGLTDKRQFDFTRDERGRWVAMNATNHNVFSGHHTRKLPFLQTGAPLRKFRLCHYE